MSHGSKGKFIEYWGRGETGPITFQKEFDTKVYWPRLKELTKKYGIEYTNNATNSAGRRVRGFKNIKAVLRLPMETKDGWQKVWPEDNPFEKT